MIGPLSDMLFGALPNKIQATIVILIVLGLGAVFLWAKYG
jgi:hypothetical protein